MAVLISIQEHPESNETPHPWKLAAAAADPIRSGAVQQDRAASRTRSSSRPTSSFTYSLESFQPTRARPKRSYRDGCAAGPDSACGSGRLGRHRSRWNLGRSANPAISIAVEKDFKCMHGERAEDPTPTNGKGRRDLSAPFAASFGIDPGVVTSWSPSHRGFHGPIRPTLVITKSFRRSTSPAGTAAGNPGRRPSNRSPTC
jgi:hypothetical protein